MRQFRAHDTSVKHHPSYISTTTVSAAVSPPPNHRLQQQTPAHLLRTEQNTNLPFLQLFSKLHTKSGISRLPPVSYRHHNRATTNTLQIGNASTHRRDVKPSTSNIRRNEHIPLSGLKLPQCSQPLGLAHLSVQTYRLEAQVTQQKGYPLRNTPAKNDTEREQSTCTRS